MNEIELIGKHLLIGITVLDVDEKVLEQIQTHGKIVSVDDENGIAIDKADGSGLFVIPPDVTNLHPASKGEYRLRATGEVVVDPDLTSMWTVYDAEDGDIEAYRTSGFSGYL